MQEGKISLLKLSFSKISNNLIFALVFFTCLSSISFSQEENPSCTNLNFINQDFTGWTCTRTIYPGAPGNTLYGAPGTTNPAFYNIEGDAYYTRHTIITDPTPDPNTCNNLSPIPPGGTISARIGNGNNNAGPQPLPFGLQDPVDPTWVYPMTGVGGEIDKISYTMDVFSYNSLLTYKYAIVLQNPQPPYPPHNDFDRPRFIVEITDYEGNLIDPVCGSFEDFADSLVEGFRFCPPDIVYRAWTTVSVDLSKFADLPAPQNQVTIKFTTQDCALLGHFGYAYVTADCDSLGIEVDYCESDTVATLTAPPGFTYEWYDGTTTQTIRIEDPKEGQKIDVHLFSIKGCKTTLSTVLQPMKATAEFETDKEIICVGDQIQFTDLSFGFNPRTNQQSQIESWDWDFGDGELSNEQNPIHTYQFAGSYTITLNVVTENGCLATYEKDIIVRPFPIAKYKTDDVCVGQVQLFTDESYIPGGGTIDSWEWDFGDNSSSTDQHSSHSYNQAGTYDVTLIVKSVNGCTDSLTKTINAFSIPSSDFESSPICAGKIMQFTSTSTIGNNDSITKWFWDFGDTTAFSSQENPAHLYRNSGTFNVQLITTSSNGCQDTITKPVVVHPNVTPDFIAESVCVNSTTVFKDNTPLGSGKIDNQVWDFGDGNTSTEASPEHSYNTPGIVEVKYTITTDKGCIDSTTKLIEVFPEPPIDFSFPDVCAYDPVEFENQSYAFNPDEIVSYAWDFGDNNKSTEENPSHIYGKAETFDVELTITTKFGCVNTLTRSITPFPSPKANFTYTNPCLGTSAQFTDESTTTNGATVTSWIWDFGDDTPFNSFPDPGHVYDTLGVFDVTLTVRSENGCVSDTTIAVEVYPNPIINFSPERLCVGDKTQFEDLSTVEKGKLTQWFWDFGVDGITSTVQNPYHQYETDGFYEVTLIGTTDMGCTDSLTKVVEVVPLPEIAFFADTTEGCVPLCVDFKEYSYNSFDTIVKWTWDFGDGNSGGNQVLQHCYDEAGKFDVTLTVETVKGCKNKLTKRESITVFPYPEAKFSADPTKTTMNEPHVNFVDESIDPEKWSWVFGDGGYSLEQHPRYKYTKPGNYTVQLIVENQHGCIDTTYGEIIVDPYYPVHILIPNAFTPNGDGLNDTFFPSGHNLSDGIGKNGMEKFTFLIFDRWGNKIFETNELYDGWDGRVHKRFRTGKYRSQIDVYVWKIIYYDELNDETIRMVGRVSLIK